MQNFDKMDHMHFIRKLPIPQELKKEMPLTPELAAYKDKRDQEIAAIIRSECDKLLLVIGPCSADREDAVKSRICTRVFAPFAIFTCVPCRRPGCLVQTRCCTRRITGI